MKTIIMGNKALAVNCTEEITKRKDIKIQGVVICQNDNFSGENSLGNYAQNNNIKILNPNKEKGRKLTEIINKYSPDIIFSMSYDIITKKDILEIPKLGAINIHFGSLPKYRGCYTIDLALINGEKNITITAHYMDEGTDSGDIIDTKEVPIKSNDTSKTLYNLCAIEGKYLFEDVLNKIINNKVERRPQDLSKSSFLPKGYYPRNPPPFEKKVFWGWDAEFIERYVRACTFEPYEAMHFTHEGNKLEIHTRIYIGEKSNNPGEVLSLENESFIVSAGDKYIIVPYSSFKINKVNSSKRKLQEIGIRNRTILNSSLEENISTLDSWYKYITQL